MNVIEVGDTFNCDCGFSWKRGQSGSHNCGDGLRKQIAELQQKLDAVLAENVMLKGFIDEECYTLGEAWSSNGQITDAAQSVPETPATNAILNAVRAEGAASVGTLIRACADEFPDSAEDIVEECAMIADNKSAQLRAETDTTPSQYESLAGGK